MLFDEFTNSTMQIALRQTEKHAPNIVDDAGTIQGQARRKVFAIGAPIGGQAGRKGGYYHHVC